MKALLRRLVPVVRPRLQEPELKVKAGRFTFRYYSYAQGERARTRHTFPLGTSEDQARKQMAAIIARVNAANTGTVVVGPITFGEFTKDHWPAYLKTKNVKPSTIYGYESVLRNHILPQIGEKLLEDITPADIAVLLSKLNSKASKYRLNIYGQLDTMFDLARQYDLIEQSPVRAKIHRPEGVSKKKPALTVDQVRRVLEEIDPAYSVLHWTIALTGIRLGEALAIQVKYLDLTLGRLGIEKGLWRGRLQEGPKTEGSVATFGLVPLLREMLRAHLDRPDFTGPDDYVFCRPDGKPIDPDHLRNVVLYPAMDRAGIHRESRAYGYHIFRHSAGRIVYEGTRDLKAAQDMLRHTRISTTSDIYMDRNQGVADEALELLAEAITGKLATDKVS